MIISNRLSKVANLVTIGNRVADIGCDHAYTSIYLIKNKISSKIIAMDINQGPLDRALENIKKYQYNKYIETRLSNGLDKLKKDEVDTILISGMGGNLIVDILDKNLDTVYKVKELILQPQSDIYKVREYIKRIGFMIIDEDILIDEDKYYNIIKTTNKRYINDDNIKDLESKYDLIETEHIYYSRVLLERRNEVLKEFLENQYNKKERIITNLLKNSSKAVNKRKETIIEEIKIIRQALKYYN
ncbi:MAG TPA: SAM-dependent methyltransferase [Clostridiales bacterium]|nr:SAM-dependent methyltransferase [Clostridiales bacterium]